MIRDNVGRMAVLIEALLTLSRAGRRPLRREGIDMGEMARYALEQIPDAAAVDALRGALGRLKGRALAGLVAAVALPAPLWLLGAQVATGSIRLLDAIAGWLSAVPLGSVGLQPLAEAFGERGRLSVRADRYF